MFLLFYTIIPPTLSAFRDLLAGVDFFTVPGELDDNLDEDELLRDLPAFSNVLTSYSETCSSTSSKLHFG